MKNRLPLQPSLLWPPRSPWEGNRKGEDDTGHQRPSIEGARRGEVIGVCRRFRCTGADALRSEGTVPAFPGHLLLHRAR